MADLTLPGSLAEHAAQLAGEARAAETKRSYQSALRTFAAFCKKYEIAPRPTPQAACAYVVHLVEAGRSVATIERALVALGHAAAAQGLPSPREHPALLEVVRGARRRIGVAPRQKRAVTVPQLRSMSQCLDGGKRGVRDRALLVVGYAGAFRRSELVGLDLADVQWTEDGVLLRVRRSKTDQEGRGATRALPHGSSTFTCPVRTLRTWLELRGDWDGPLFVHIAAGGRVTRRRLNARQVARLVQRTAKAVGLDPEAYAGHSLRAGLITAAAGAGKSDWSIMRQSGHASPATLAGYVREARAFDDNAAEGIGL